MRFVSLRSEYHFRMCVVLYEYCAQCTQTPTACYRKLFRIKFDVFRPTPKVIYSSSCLFSLFSLFFFRFHVVVAVVFIIQSQHETKASFWLCERHECWAIHTVKKSHTYSGCKWLCVFPLDSHCLQQFSRLGVGFLSHSLQWVYVSISESTHRYRSTKTKRYRDAWIVANKRFWLDDFIRPIE